MARAEQEPCHAVLRTEKNMKLRKRIFTVMSEGAAPKARETAQKRANRVGVNLDVQNAWYDGDAGQDERVFGTCPRRDNIFQVLPQPNLHGMDEGLTQKTNLGVVIALIREAKRLHGLSLTEVHTINTLNVLHNVNW
jgi:hypothetical protein